MKSDVTLADGSILDGSRELNVNGYSLNVAGTLYHKGTLRVSSFGRTEDGQTYKGMINIDGDYRQEDGILMVSDGTVNIGGDYYCRKNDGPGKGYFRMENTAGGMLDVDGDVTLDTSGVGGQWYGTFAIGGDLTVGAGESYYAGNSLVTEFKGGRAHKASFASDKSHTSSIKMGVGDSVDFDGAALNGIVRDSDSSIESADTSIASVSGFVVKGVKQGESC